MEGDTALQLSVVGGSNAGFFSRGVTWACLNVDRKVPVSKEMFMMCVSLKEMGGDWVEGTGGGVVGEKSGDFSVGKLGGKR